VPRIGRDRLTRFVPASLAAFWLLGLSVVYFHRGWGRPLNGFEGVGLDITRHPDFAAFGQLGSTLLIAASALGAGGPIVGRLLPEWTGWPRVTLTTVVGFGALGVLFLACAAAGVYRPGVLIAVTIAFAAPAVARELPGIRRSRIALPRLGLAGWTAAALFALTFAFVLASALTPETGVDPLWYHLGFPAHWLRSGHLDDFPLQYVAVYPFGAELVYGQALAFDGETTGRLLHLVFGLLTIAGTVDLGRRLFSTRAGVVGGLVVAAAPLVMWEASTAHVDLVPAAFGVFAVDVAVASRLRPTRRAAVAVGLLMSFALATKLIAAFAFPAVALLLLWGSPGRALRDRVIDTAIVTVMTPLAALPYLIRAETLTGNPFFPSFYKLFGADSGRFNADSNQGLQHLLDSFGDGHGASRFVTLPWDITMRTGHFNGTFGILFLLLIPLALRLRPRRLPLLVGLGVLLYFCCWFFIGRTLQARFLVGAFALAGPFAGAGFDRALSAMERIGRPAALALCAGLSAVVVLMMPPFLPWWDREVDSGRTVGVAIYGTPLPFLLGAERPEQFLIRKEAIAQSDMVLARLARPGDRALSVDSLIDNTHTTVEHAPFFATQLGLIYDKDATDAQELALLRRWHLRFIVVNRETEDARPDGPIAVLATRFVRRHLRLVHSDPRSLLYEVRQARSL
jgi:Dolichyl-phosphate-mannose-protein mannosyltransferase